MMRVAEIVAAQIVFVMRSTSAMQPIVTMVALTITMRC
jgi:hypothetical protein